MDQDRNDDRKDDRETPVAEAHKRRSKIELYLALIGALLGGVGALSGLNGTAQTVLATAVAVVILAAGFSFLRHRGAKRRGE